MSDDAQKGGGKEKTKDDKVAVATSGAAFVIIVLLIIWGFYFFKSISNGSQELQLGGGFGDQLAPSSAVKAQQQLQNAYSGSAASIEELKQIRANASAGSGATMDVQSTDTGGTLSPFGDGGY